jgi:YD repeat-containing protein
MGTTYYTNDAVGNLTYLKYPSSPSVSFQYDSLNRLTNMVDAVGTTKYTYTTGNQLQTQVGPFASDTLTLKYTNRLRATLKLQQPQVFWTNAFFFHLTISGSQENPTQKTQNLGQRRTWFLKWGSSSEN